MLYRGEQYDTDLGLYYLRARYYNPITGRFMSRDPNNPQLLDPNGIPIDPSMLHKYLYAGGNPVDAIDPTGRGELFEDVLIEGGSLTGYPGLRGAGYAAADLLCTAAKFLANSLRAVSPTVFFSAHGIPAWPIKPTAALCTALGF
jgi:RHS repeat-associated protein